MIDLDISSVAKELLGMPNEGLSTNSEWRYGTRGSLKVNLTKNTWFDHEANIGGGTLDLINRSIGGDHFAALKWLDARDARPPKPNGNGATHHQIKPRIVATYDYVNEDDELLFQVVRFEPKDFRQRRPDGRGGWIWKLDNTRRVLFKLPQLIEAIAADHPVFIVEGEKDCEALAKLNIVATTNCGGANKWRPKYNAVFSGADVVLIPDNDAAGHEHMQDVAAQLVRVAGRVRLVELPGLAPKGDVSDWIAAGGTRELLDALVEKASTARRQGTINGSGEHAPPERPARNDWWRAELINAQALCDQKFPEVKYVVPGLFPEGVTLLAARPKIGKSWLLLQIGTAIASGTITLVADKLPEGDVLYLALEDNPRRLQRRLKKYFGPDKATWPARLTIVTKWKRLDEGGLEALAAWCKSVAKPTLIMIDTLKKVRKPKRNGQSDYDADYEACEPLIQLAGELGLAIIANHHDRKMDAEDVFDTVSGTLGLTGGVDTIAIIKRRASGTTLHIEGRDLIETIEKAVSFDRETCKWVILGEASEVQRSSERARVLVALKGASEGLSTSEIIGLAQLAGRNAADVLLGRMAADGEIERVKRGLYGLPGTRAYLSARNMRQKTERSPNH